MQAARFSKLLTFSLRFFNFMRILFALFFKVYERKICLYSILKEAFLTISLTPFILLQTCSRVAGGIGGEYQLENYGIMARNGTLNDIYFGTQNYAYRIAACQYRTQNIY